MNVLGLRSEVEVQKAPESNIYILKGRREDTRLIFSFLEKKGVSFHKTKTDTELTDAASFIKDEIEQERLNIDRLILKGVEDSIKFPLSANQYYVSVSVGVDELINSLKDVIENRNLEENEHTILNEELEMLKSYSNELLHVLSLLTPEGANSRYVEIRNHLENRLKNHEVMSDMNVNTPSLRVGSGPLTYEVSESRKKVSRRVRAEFYLELLEKSLLLVNIGPAKPKTIHFKRNLSKFWTMAFRNFMQAKGDMDKDLVLRLNTLITDSALIQLSPKRLLEYSDAGAKGFFEDLNDSGLLGTLANEILKVTVGKSDLTYLSEGLSYILTYAESPLEHYSYEFSDDEGHKKSVVVNIDYTLENTASDQTMCFRILN